MIKGGDSHGAYEQGSDRDRGSPGHRQGHRRTAGEGWDAGDVFFCKAVIPTMKEKKAGRIINMASQSAETGGLAASPIYAASKAAVWCMTKSLAGEMGPYQVTVNAVAPGYIMTEMTRNAGYRDDMVPMKRLGTPEDVADVVGFLASEDSRYVTGMIVDINGGTVMR